MVLLAMQVIDVLHPGRPNGPKVSLYLGLADGRALMLWCRSLKALEDLKCASDTS